jgi:23S rRNA (uracil1939-C5)-methyltransferase
MNVNEVLSLRLTDVALGGKALSRHEGRVVFVDRGLPGDQVSARLTRVRSRFAEARLERVDVPGGERVTAPCPHVARCGGCRFQDLDYGAQCRLKERQVRETLIHLGGLEQPPVRAIVPAPETFGYRNKMEFSFHPDPDGRAILGLHERGTFDRVFEIEDCLLPSRLTIDIVRRTQAFADRQRWRAYHPDIRTGGPLSGRAALAADRPVRGSSSRPPRTSSDFGMGPRARRALTEHSHRDRPLNRSRANVATGESSASSKAMDESERLHGLRVPATAAAFPDQQPQAQVLYAATLKRRPSGGETVLDSIAARHAHLLRQRREAVGVERGQTIEAATVNARHNQVTNARFVAGEARRIPREWARHERPDR